MIQETKKSNIGLRLFPDVNGVVEGKDNFEYVSLKSYI